MAQFDYGDAWTNASAMRDMFSAFQPGMATLTRYSNAFFIPFLISSAYFNREESQRFWARSPLENFSAYLKLGQMNLDLISRALSGGLAATNQFLELEIRSFEVLGTEIALVRSVRFWHSSVCRTSIFCISSCISGSRMRSSV